MEYRKLVGAISSSVLCGRTEGKGSNSFAACVNVLFIHLRTIIGLVRRNIALLLSLTHGGTSIANTQNISFSQNNTKLFRI
jgi:hypothetical protein